ncbi:hypothetical protein KC362_g96 [Hortaea werneckii]|nr:hypothetical protein KC362_g96 [Hortaea werneckii]
MPVVVDDEREPLSVRQRSHWDHVGRHGRRTHLLEGKRAQCPNGLSSSFGALREAQGARIARWVPLQLELHGISVPIGDKDRGGPCLAFLERLSGLFRTNGVCNACGGPKDTVLDRDEVEDLSDEPGKGRLMGPGPQAVRADCRCTHTPQALSRYHSGPSRSCLRGFEW